MRWYAIRCPLILLILTLTNHTMVAQRSNEGVPDNLPKEVRGYKVYRTEVEIKKSKDSNAKEHGKKAVKGKIEKEEYADNEPLLIRLGEPQLVNVSPLGITFDLPVILAAVKQQGDVDRLVFEDMKVNGTSVTIDDYVYPFKLPNKEPLTLTPPIEIFVSTPQAVLRTIDEILNSREVWPITGRIYVCGHFKKFLIKFKRAIPVELQTSIRNPLR